MNDETDLSEVVTSNAKAIQSVDKAAGGVMNALLGPTAKLLGDRLAEKTDSWLNAKQRDNIQSKIESAQDSKSISFDSGASPRQMGALIEWTEPVKDIEDRDSPRLSHAWSQALNDIAEQNFTLLDALRRVTEADIDILLRGGKLEHSSAKRLNDYNIIQYETKDYDGPWAETFAFFSLAFILICAVSAANEGTNFILFLDENDLPDTIGPLPIGIVRLLVFVASGAITYFFTDKIFAKIKRFANNHKQRKFDIELTNIGREALSRLGVEEIPVYYVRGKKIHGDQ